MTATRDGRAFLMGLLSLAGASPAHSISDLWREQRRVIPVVKDASGVHTSYQKDPVRWMVEQMQIPEHTIRWSLNPGYAKHQWDGTRDPLVQALRGLAQGDDVAVEAGTGTQKTHTLGALGMLWFLGCFENALVVTLAPKEDQLKLHLWKEARRLWPRFQQLFPQARLTDLKLRMRGGLDEAWTATGFVAGVGADEETAGKARGFHSPDALYIFEERPGIHEAIQSAIDFTCSAPHNLQLQLGNPDNEQDGLHRFSRRKGVVAVRISALDHPNVVCNDPNIVPGATSRRAIEKVKAEYGEGSDTFNAKVRGIAPKQAADSLIRWEWLEAAAARYDDLTLRQGPAALGVDVADSPQGDEYAVARGVGACCTEVVAAKIGEPGGPSNAGELGEEVALEIQLEGIDEMHVGVDSVGVGASTVNAIKKVGFVVRALNGGAKAEPRLDEDVLRDTGKGVVQEELYDNLRSQILYTLRMDLMHKRIALPYNERLFQQLTIIKWERRLGKISVEPKETPKRGGRENKNWGVKARLGYSPNEADAVAYWNWVRPRRAMPDADEQASAFSREQLEHDAKESRRMKSPKKPKPSTEYID